MVFEPISQWQNKETSPSWTAVKDDKINGCSLVSSYLVCSSRSPGRQPRNYDKGGVSEQTKEYVFIKIMNMYKCIVLTIFSLELNL